MTKINLKLKLEKNFISTYIKNRLILIFNNVA